MSNDYELIQIPILPTFIFNLLVIHAGLLKKKERDSHKNANILPDHSMQSFQLMLLKCYRGKCKRSLSSYTFVSPAQIHPTRATIPSTSHSYTHSYKPQRPSTAWKCVEAGSACRDVSLLALLFFPSKFCVSAIQWLLVARSKLTDNPVTNISCCDRRFSLTYLCRNKLFCNFNQTTGFLKNTGYVEFFFFFYLHWKIYRRPKFGVFIQFVEQIRNVRRWWGHRQPLTTLIDIARP